MGTTFIGESRNLSKTYLAKNKRSDETEAAIREVIELAEVHNPVTGIHKTVEKKLKITRQDSFHDDFAKALGYDSARDFTARKNSLVSIKDAFKLQKGYVQD